MKQLIIARKDLNTCIGFKPLPDDTCYQLSKKYELYK